MPDIHGRLTAEDDEAARKWFSDHWKGTVTCPVCKSDAWATAPHVVNIARWAVDAHSPGTASYPMLPVTSPCGYVMLFNAVVMGITPRGPEAGPPGEPMPLPAIAVGSVQNG